MTARGFLPAAETEMREAARFYEERSRGLGHDFLNEVEAQSSPLSSNSIRV